MEEKQATVVLQTKLGGLRGHTKVSVLSGKTYYAFQGIPFAKPPLGELRFKAPQPFGGWEGIRDALEDGNDPKQPMMIPLPGFDPNTAQGDEDCLYLNVFMNELPEKNSFKKPVMFSIHGGGFLCGNGGVTMCGPDFLLDGDVVIVSINYRCGAFGFLSLENDEVPGNAGLKDQTLALKWVRDNIDSFGGDPNNVTIFGTSAGGASVDYHLISPSSSGLFHKAIVQSGFSSNPWAVHLEPRTLTTHLAKALGCTSDNNSEILTFLQSVSADDIVHTTTKISKQKVGYVGHEFKKPMGLLFSPCVEMSGADPFISDTPENLLRKGELANVPVIIGCASQEGSVVAGSEYLNEEEFSSISNEKPDRLVPYFLGLASESEEKREVIEAILEFYFKGKPLSWENATDYITYQGDVLVNIGMGQSRSALVEKSSSPVYSYLYTDHTRCMCTKIKNFYSDNYFKFVEPGACHGADILNILYFTFVDRSDITTAYREAINKHVKMWTMFAAIGDPNCEEMGLTWKKDSLIEPCYLEIGTTWSMKKGIPFEERIDFWNKLRSKYCNA